MSISTTMAPNASSKSKLMKQLLWSVSLALIVGTLAACSSLPSPGPAPATETPTAPPDTPAPASAMAWPGDDAPLPAPLQRSKSLWTPVRWAELPGLASDPLHEAWNAWIKSCERPGPVFTPLCGDVRRLSLGSAEEQLGWMMQRLQPYRVEPMPGNGGATATTEGLLTGYFEPLMEASRLPNATYKVPLYQPPLTLAQRKPWYTRQEIDTRADVQATLRGREIAYLADPVEALILQIQGSGRVRVTEADGSQRLVRLAFAGSNDQPYKSVGRWLLDQGAIRDASWPAIRAWTQANPARVSEMLWSNPRTVFFREELLSELDAAFGPRGAQGVALTPGRSIAVDPASIPYGTPVWLASSGPVTSLQRLVLAQDTGSAITGAVRADYFAGWGPQAGELAGRLKQPLRLWALWPK